eukprot:359116-Chlamydomonas_euryale.AAC.6
MPGESVVKQLLFAKGLAAQGGMVGRPRSTWRDGLRLCARMSHPGWWKGGYGVAQDHAQWYALCDSAQPAASSPLPCYAQHRHILCGSAPCNSDSDSDSDLDLDLAYRPSSGRIGSRCGTEQGRGRHLRWGEAEPGMREMFLKGSLEGFPEGFPEGSLEGFPEGFPEGFLRGFLEERESTQNRAGAGERERDRKMCAHT